MGLALLLGGCMTNDQGQTVMDPDKVSKFVSAVLTPPPPAKGDDGANPDDQGYAPAPNDQAVADATQSDIVVQNGNTYVMATDAAGHRRAVFYGHGDVRAQVIARHEQLRQVMADNGNKLPTRAIPASRTLAANAKNPRPSASKPVNNPSGSATRGQAVATAKPAAVAQPTKAPAATAKKARKKTT